MDAGEKLQSILSSPDGMEKLQEAAKQLQGVLGESGDLSGILQSFAGSLPAAPEKKVGMDLSLLTKAAPFLQEMQKEDDSTKLLRALRPYMHGERQKRLDEAIEILKWLRLATMLKEQGVL